jgi:hypothetical protein
MRRETQASSHSPDVNRHHHTREHDRDGRCDDRRRRRRMIERHSHIVAVNLAFHAILSMLIPFQRPVFLDVKSSTLLPRERALSLLVVDRRSTPRTQTKSKPLAERQLHRCASLAFTIADSARNGPSFHAPRHAACVALHSLVPRIPSFPNDVPASAFDQSGPIVQSAA